MSAKVLDRPKILVVDDERPQLEILERWLSHSGYEPVIAGSAVEALALADQHRFEVVITDLRMPGLSGLQLLTIFKELDPDLEVVFLSGQATMHDAIEALREGRAFDFLQKPLKELPKLNLVIEKARARRHQLAEEAAAALGSRKALPDWVEPLTPQERDLMFWLARGHDNRQIADQLHFSEKTIRNYLSRVYDKLGVGNRLQAVAFCQAHGLIEHA